MIGAPASAPIPPAQAPAALIVSAASICQTLAGAAIFQDRASDPIALAEQAGHPLIGQCLAPILARRGDVDADAEERVGRAIGDGEGAADPGIEARLAAQRLADWDLFARHAVLMAGGDETLGIVRRVPGGDDEQSAGILDAARQDPAQDRVLGRAVPRGDRVFRHVAPAGMEQAVIAPGRAAGEVAALDQDRAEAAHRQVAQDARAGHPAADHQHIGCPCSHRCSSRAH